MTQPRAFGLTVPEGMMGKTAEEVAKVKLDRNVGHGHVHPRPDGVKARCGGPKYCPECKSEEDALFEEPPPKPKAVSALTDCEIQPRPLRYSLEDYHRAGSDGPLHATWVDKPHRLLYDLIAAVRHYAILAAPSELETAIREGEFKPGEWTDSACLTVERNPSLALSIISKLKAEVASLRSQLNKKPAEIHVCPRHDFELVTDLEVGCVLCNAEKARQQHPSLGGAGT